MDRLSLKLDQKMGQGQSCELQNILSSNDINENPGKIIDNTGLTATETADRIYNMAIRKI
jgi:hypothetical protein